MEEMKREIHKMADEIGNAEAIRYLLIIVKSVWEEDKCRKSNSQGKTYQS